MRSGERANPGYSSQRSVDSYPGSHNRSGICDAGELLLSEKRHPASDRARQTGKRWTRRSLRPATGTAPKAHSVLAIERDSRRLGGGAGATDLDAAAAPPFSI